MALDPPTGPIVCGLGPIGRRVAELAGSTLTAVVDIDPAAGDGFARERGVPFYSDLGEALETHPAITVVLATRSDFTAIADDLRTAAAAGSDVVTCCEEASWPRARHPDLVDELDATARAADVTLLGGGINPGFLMDVMPAVVCAPLPPAEKIVVLRRVDVATRRRPLQEKVGVGLTPEAFETRRRESGIGHRGLEESIHLLGAALGITWDRVESTVDPVVAKRPVEVGEETLERGRVIGMRNTGRGWLDDRCRVELECTMAWGIEQPVDRIELSGPAPYPLRFEVPGGVPGDEGTARVLKALVARLPEMPSGYRTLLDVPGGLRGCWADWGQNER